MSDLFEGNILKKLSRLLSTQVIALGAGFIAHLVMIKFMSASEYGIYSFIISVSTLLCLFGTFGLQSSAVRLVPRYQDESKDELFRFLLSSDRFVILFSILVSIFGYGALYAFGFHEDYTLPCLILGALIVPFMARLKLSAGIFKGLQKGSWGFSYESTFKEIMLVTALLLIQITGLIFLNSSSVLTAVLIIYALLSVISMRHILKTTGYRPNKNQKRSISSNWLKISYPMMLVVAAQVLIHRADIVTLGFFVETAEVGYYAGAAKLSQAAGFGFVAMNIIFSPLASKYFQQGDFVSLKSVYIKTAVFQFLITAVLAGFLFMCGPLILSFFGQDYLSAKGVLYVLLVGFLINCAWGPIPFLMIMTKFEIQAMWITLSAAVLNIVLNVIFIQIYGLVGAAIASVIVLNLRNLTGLIYVSKKGVFKKALYNEERGV